MGLGHRSPLTSMHVPCCKGSTMAAAARPAKRARTSEPPAPEGDPQNWIYQDLIIDGNLGTCTCSK